jgi:hypothetical protein
MQEGGGEYPNHYEDQPGLGYVYQDEEQKLKGRGDERYGEYQAQSAEQ